MSIFFIHTFEINKIITFEEYNNLKETLDCFPDRTAGNSKLYPFTSTAYVDKGIIITFRKCTDKEKLKYTYDMCYKLIIQVNPSRLIEEGTYKNSINDIYEFIIAIKRLNKFIAEILGNIINNAIDVNDFNLSRIDFTKDIKEIHENIIKQFILIMRRMPLCKGYRLNTKLEEKCDKFSREDSYNVLSKSKGVEFVLYNKHKAAIDRGYPEDIVDFYHNTLRMELRCERKYIRRYTNNEDTYGVLCMLYNKMEQSVRSIYNAMIKCSTACCYTGSYLAEKIIEKQQNGKKKRKNKMIKLLRYCEKNCEYDLKTVGINLFNSMDVYDNIQNCFEEMGLNPIPVTIENIGFIQSPDSLLGFKEISDTEIKYYKTAKKKCKGRNEVHLYV